ncbi:MAG: amino acid permease [Thaumarchaeota archaeon]|nr:amino acid permease [Nitrososphaerota archaeon]
MGARDVFLRNATGLRREFGVIDTIWINLSLVGIIFSITFVAYSAPLVAGDPLQGGLIAFVGMFIVGLAFSIVSIIVPRTAGDYVFTSRYLHPALGFVGNAGYFVATVPFFIGITITTIESFGFSSLFAYWGLVYNNSSFLNLASTLYLSPTDEYLLGAGTTIVFALLPFFGYRLYKAMNKIVLPLILLGVIVMFGILAFTSQTSAWAHLDSLTSSFGNSTFAEAVNATAPAAPASFSGTLALNGIYVVGFSYIISAIYVAGEVKQVQRNMPLAILGTLLITLVMFAGGTLLLYHAFGYGFLTNIYTKTVINLGTVSPLPAAFVPYINFLAAAISGNVYLGTFIIVVSILQLLWYQTNAVFIGSRLLLSYSFDRIMPSFMGDVSGRWNVPAKGMIVSLIIGLVAGLFFVLPFASSAAFALSTAAVAIIVIFPITVVGIAMITYRIRHKKEYQASAIAKSNLGGGVYWFAAIFTVVYGLFTFYQYLTNPLVFASAGSLLGYEYIFIPIIILFLIYYVSKTINARKGVQFSMIFAEIPPE